MEIMKVHWQLQNLLRKNLIDNGLKLKPLNLMEEILVMIIKKTFINIFKY